MNDTITINALGLFELTLENTNLFLNLSSTSMWHQKIAEINRELGEEISIVVDNILGTADGESSHYEMKANDLGVVIVRNSTAETNANWWFNNLSNVKNPDLMMVTSASSDARIQVGTILKAKYPSGLIPITEFAQKLWWYEKSQSMDAFKGESSKMEIEKIVDKLVVSKYNTLIGRVIDG
jgi:hypothetical protein